MRFFHCYTTLRIRLVINSCSLHTILETLCGRQVGNGITTPNTFAPPIRRLHYSNSICWVQSTRLSSILTKSLARHHFLTHLRTSSPSSYTLLENLCEIHSLTICLLSSVFVWGGGTYHARVVIYSDIPYRIATVLPLYFLLHLPTSDQLLNTSTTQKWKRLR